MNANNLYDKDLIREAIGHYPAFSKGEKALLKTLISSSLGNKIVISPSEACKKSGLSKTSVVSYMRRFLDQGFIIRIPPIKKGGNTFLINYENFCLICDYYNNNIKVA